VLPLYKSKIQLAAFISEVYVVSNKAIQNFDKELRRTLLW